MVNVDGKGNAAASDPDNREFWYIDRWSSHFTWGCNDTSVECKNKPVDHDIAVIPKGKTILLDETTPILSVLLIQGGTLLWAHKDGISLRAQYILITDEGHFEAGTPTEPLCGKNPANPINADIELFGHHRQCFEKNGISRIRFPKKIHVSVYDGLAEIRKGYATFSWQKCFLEIKYK